AAQELWRPSMFRVVALCAFSMLLPAIASAAEDTNSANWVISPLTKCRRSTGSTACCANRELYGTTYCCAKHSNRFCQRAARWGGRPPTASMCQGAGCRDLQREPPAMSITMIGLDTAKSVFQLHGVGATGEAQLKRKLRRSELTPFF